ncbi:SIS domain-containing protein [Alteromonas sp. ASW11-36]|uniref:SIS domain-containing protein n=1 Tax=Alteromonas arenosi TaxID=3055817 RepID=A0ABT7SSF1_9ALTE|nr:SIS domain-containing protein [Alteromonas sp. ASW11-36]MDM7859095.1 SIS domain-containing protein [Alteromonas sp. ASW11-36]
MSNVSLMFQEASDTPNVVAQQRQANQQACEALAKRLRQQPPTMIFMIGRGTSDHAGVFAKYLFEVGCSIPVCAAAPSVAGVFGSQLNLRGALAIVISQSGRSPDILRQTEAAKRGGATTLALVNDVESPLAEVVDFVLPLHANQEKAVAATKSYLATLHALCQLFGCWMGDEALNHSLTLLPSQLQRVQALPAQLTADDLQDVKHCVVLGRGFGYAIGREVALKLKEVLGIHAEAFSSAEFLHGPVTLAHNHLLVLDIGIADESLESHQQQIRDVETRGARVRSLTVPSELHPRLHALLVMQRFYLDIESIAADLGLNPDEPIGLKKVTQTL